MQMQLISIRQAYPGGQLFLGTRENVTVMGTREHGKETKGNVLSKRGNTDAHCGTIRLHFSHFLFRTTLADLEHCRG